MFKKFIAILIFFAISPFVLAANPTEEEIKAVLDEAKTIAEVERYEQITAFHWQKNAIENVAPENVDEAETQALHDLGQMQIAAGERIKFLARLHYDLEKYHTLTMKGQQNLIRWAKQKNNKEKELQYWRDFGKSYKAKDKLVFNREYNKFLREKVYPLDKPKDEFSMEKFNETLEEIKEWSIKEHQTNPVSLLMYAIDFAEDSAEAAKNPNLTQETLEQLIQFVQSEEFLKPEDVRESAVSKLEKRFLRLIGSDLKLFGKTPDDKDFDWDALRGKYVVVKFTATWCGPCKGELPGLISAYEKYKDKGLEIVSAYVWERGDDADKCNENIIAVAEKENVTWQLISEPLTVKAGQPKIGEFYGIQGVPTMLLIDKEGKIIDTAARGKHLQDKLAEIFGEE